MLICTVKFSDDLAHKISTMIFSTFLLGYENSSGSITNNSLSCLKPELPSVMTIYPFVFLCDNIIHLLYGVHVPYRKVA